MQLQHTKYATLDAEVQLWKMQNCLTHRHTRIRCCSFYGREKDTNIVFAPVAVDFRQQRNIIKMSVMVADPTSSLTYRVVGKSWRKRVEPRKRKYLKPISNPMMVDLLRGKTILVDRDSYIKENRFTAWYTIFLSRGYNLRNYEVDDISEDIYRARLLWLEKRQTYGDSLIGKTFVSKTKILSSNLSRHAISINRPIMTNERNVYYAATTLYQPYFFNS